MSKLWVFVGAFALAVTLVAVGFAAYMIYSNTITVNVSQYTLSLQASPLNVNQYEIVTLTATLDLDGDPAGSGKTVHFYQAQSEIGTALTDQYGVASLQWNATNVGSIDFKAGYEVT